MCMRIASSMGVMACSAMAERLAPPRIIDVHAHFVPHDFPVSPSSAAAGRWPCLCHRSDGSALISMGKKPFRELDARSWDLAARGEAMALEGIAQQVLSPMPELLSYWLDASDTLQLARHMNGAMAGLVERGRGLFRAFAMVPLQDPALAAAELSRLKADGFNGIEIGSNVNSVLPGDGRFFDFYAEAERLDLAVFVHALHPIGTDRLADMPDLAPFAAFPLDTALAIASLLRAGVPARFPRLRLGFSHGGGAVVPVVHRLHKAWTMSEGFGGELPQPPRYYAARFFYDSLVYDPGYLRYLTREFAPGQFFAGTDFPYAIEQTGLRGFLEATTDDPEDPVFHAAAERFLGR